MKAALVTRYGPPNVVAIGDTPTPTPIDDEVLVRVHCSTVSRTDCGERAPHPPGLGRLMYGLARPRRAIFGVDFAGFVEATGRGVTLFKPGDRVFGICPIRRNGAHAEFCCLPERGPIALLPANVEFEKAVVCEGAYYADASLKRLDLKPGCNLLIYGASGAIGSSAVQLAKLYGANVTAVVGTQHVALAESLGADRVIDYLEQDFSALDEKFDGAFDAVGKTTFFKCRKVLKREGAFMAADMGPGGQNIYLLLWSLITGNRRVRLPVSPSGGAAGFVQLMRRWLERGEFRAVVDRAYPLDQIAEAYNYVETGQKTGIVVVKVSS